MPRKPEASDRFETSLVVDPLFEGWRRPEGWSIVTIDSCRGCGASIAWALTANHKYAPLDPSGISHFATCPRADRFRRSIRRKA